MAAHPNRILLEADAMTVRRDSWPVCSRCRVPVPQFALIDSLQCELLSLIEHNYPNDAARLLQVVSGCEADEARVWVAHHSLTCLSNPLCPQCCHPLRTPDAKQCRFCHADWHSVEEI